MHFWRIMKYKCNGCSRELEMRLEDGCEGPPGGREISSAAFDSAGQPEVVTLRFTRSKQPRLIQPVPFTLSCTCNTTIPGAFNRSSKAYLSHVEWQNDRTIDVTTDEPDFPYFKYDASENPQACGIPTGHR